MLPVGSGSTRLSVKFYLVAMLFILFDVEGVFLYPWAVVYREMLKENANLIFGAMVSFLGVLFVGYIYALKKRSEEHTSELQSPCNLVCRLLLEKKNGQFREVFTDGVRQTWRHMCSLICR